MSMIPVPDDPGLRTPLGQAPSPPDPVTHLLFGAAFRQSNIVVSAVQALRNSGPFAPEDGYTALPDIKGTGYFDRHSDRFAASTSRAETASIKRQIDLEESDRRITEASGALGIIAMMGAGSADPTMLLPGRVAVGVAKEGAAFLRGALEVGAAMGVQAAAQETGLHATQQTRTLGESAINITSATVLGALIGGGATGLLAREGRLAPAVAALDRDRAEMAAHVNGEPPKPATNIPENIPSAPPLIPEPPSPARGEGVGALESTVGAAATDTRKLELVSAFGLQKLPTDPMSRLINSPSVAARRAAVDLAEPTGRFVENLEGIPTTSGPSLDRLVRLATNQTKVAVGDRLDELWKGLRFGGEEAPWFARARDALGTLDRPPELPNFDQFKVMVSDALRNGDQHAIPQVQEAAQFIRAKVFDPWKERAIKAGLLPEGIETKTADSYLQRVYNKQAIAAQRPEFVNTVLSWMQGDQATKAGAKERLTFFNAQLNSWESHIGKMEARFGRAEERAKMLDARAAERSRDERQLTAGLNEPDPQGRVFELQRRKVELQAEAHDLNEMIGAMREMSGFAIPAILKQNAAALERRLVSARVEGARLSEAGRTAKTSQRRLDAIEAQLDKTESRKDLIEETLALAEGFRNEVRAKIEAELGAWEGKSASEAKSAIKSREKYAQQMSHGEEAPRLTGADSAVDRAVRRIIESDRDLSTAELRDRAHQITERILGSPDGRLPYDEAMGGPQGFRTTGEPPRGPLAGREFNIPDAQIAKWLENDIEHVVNSHLRTMVPDVLLAERFGDTAMTEAFRKIEDDFARLIDGTKSEAARTKLEKQREAAIRDLAAIRDRIRGVYGMDQFNTMRGAARIAQAAKNYNVLASMGMATVSSLPDMAGSVFRHGLGTVFSDAYAPFMRYLMGGGDEWKQAGKQFRAMGIATESVIAQRHHALSEIMDNYRPASRLERTLQWGADKFQFANLLAPWTDWGKINASMVAGAEILRAAEAVTKGSATKKQIASLAESGIDSHLATRIWGEFSREGTGEVVNGVHLPNTDRWQSRSARDAFEGAVGREADIAIVTPGQEKPLWLSNPIISVIGQFKSFTAAATQRILIANLQRSDAQTLQGLIFSMGLGMMSYKLNSTLGGQPTSEKPGDWIKEAMSRGSIFGWLEEGNALTAKMTRGRVDMYRLVGTDKPLSRYAGRSVLDQILGPTAGKIEALAQVTGAAAARDWKESDTKAVHKLTAFGNLFYLRGLFNQVERGANNAFGIPMKEPVPH